MQVQQCFDVIYSNGSFADIVVDRAAARIFKIIVPSNETGSSRKRASNDDRSKSSQKRPKLRREVDANPIEAQPVYGDNGVKFLELPAELRNRIYEYAVEYSHRCFPMLHQKPKAVKLIESPGSVDLTGSSSPKPRRIPYLGLTQVCMQIRAEFRPMWLSTHRIPLCFMNSYLKAFFPARVPKVTRFNPHALIASALRIWVRKDDLGTYLNGCDMTRLFKHKARFPDCAISCQSLPSTEDSTLRDLEQLINHDDPVWRRFVTVGRISQVRLSLNGPSTVVLYIVMKERFAEPWMKAYALHPPTQLDGFLRQFGLGLDNRKWEARVSVDYS